MAESLRDHCRRVAGAIAEGRVIPFLGAGVNLGASPPAAGWLHGAYLPTAGELAQYLARKFGYPQDQVPDLVRVSEYASVMNGSGPLYEELHRVFDADYPIGLLPRFLAGLPGQLEPPGQPRSRCQLIITTNYDDALERAFRESGEPFDLVCYMAEGAERGKFVHWPAGGERTVIDIPNEYGQLKAGQQTVILKVHGAIDRADSGFERDSYVITEDHYIDYLSRTEVGNLLPVMLASQMRRSHFLFLGYSMRDWNLRVILQRIWGEQTLRYNSWAIQRDPDTLDREFWKRRGVDVYDVPLEEYVAALKAALSESQSAATRP